ncbi:hypothetical protein KSP39_PZI016330 [Platanthera zijinensis]|uniref:CCHC-type domain-containing protein n=1 Tax=Platanthera zijinensis TaxID=2320716 RepID=A0AAP0B7D4_9ASPA
MKMSDDASVTTHLNSFNTVTNQLSSVDIKFDDEVRALLLLSSLPDSWDSLVTAVSNSSENSKLKFDDTVGLVLNEEVCKRANSGTSNSALNVESRGRHFDRNSGRGCSKSARGKSKPHKGKFECWNCGKKGHLKAFCTAPKKNPGGKVEKNPAANATVDDLQDTLILSLDNTECWVVDSGASFHACPTRSSFKNFTAGDLGKVYLGNNQACDIIGKGDVDIRFPNGSIWSLTDVRHVPCLRRNLISVSQLAKQGTFAAFGDKSWKATKGSMVIARGTLDDTLYVINKESDSISIAKKDDDAELWHNRLGHMSEKGMKSLISNDILAGLKFVDLDFYEDCVFDKQSRVSFSKSGRELKTQRLELVHTDV